MVTNVSSLAVNLYFDISSHVLQTTVPLKSSWWALKRSTCPLADLPSVLCEDWFSKTEGPAQEGALLIRHRYLLSSIQVRKKRVKKQTLYIDLNSSERNFICSTQPGPIRPTRPSLNSLTTQVVVSSEPLPSSHCSCSRKQEDRLDILLCWTMSDWSEQ